MSIYKDNFPKIQGTIATAVSLDNGNNYQQAINFYRIAKQQIDFQLNSNASKLPDKIRDYYAKNQVDIPRRIQYLESLLYNQQGFNQVPNYVLNGTQFQGQPHFQQNYGSPNYPQNPYQMPPPQHAPPYYSPANNPVNMHVTNQNPYNQTAALYPNINNNPPINPGPSPYPNAYPMNSITGSLYPEVSQILPPEQPQKMQIQNQPQNNQDQKENQQQAIQNQNQNQQNNKKQTQNNQKMENNQNSPTKANFSPSKPKQNSPQPTPQEEKPVKQQEPQKVQPKPKPTKEVNQDIKKVNSPVKQPEPPQQVAKPARPSPNKTNSPGSRVRRPNPESPNQRKNKLKVPPPELSDSSSDESSSEVIVRPRRRSSPRREDKAEKTKPEKVKISPTKTEKVPSKIEPKRRQSSSEDDEKPKIKHVFLSDYLIETKHFRKMEILGRGGFGCVYLVKEKETGKLFAMKELLGEFKSLDDEKAFFREIELLMIADHPGVMNFRGFSMLNSEHKRSATIVIEFLPNKSLQEVIEKKKRMSFTQKIINLYGVAEAMRYLHSIDIVHRDLKPANVLLNSEDEPVVGDFGLSKVMNQESMRQTQAAGSPVYMAPELMERQEYTKSVDVYAYGFLCYEVLTESLAFARINSVAELVNMVIRGRRPPVQKANIDDKYKELIEACWDQTPANRPTFKQICQYFISGRLLTENVDKAAFNRYVRKIEKCKAQTS
ncbi:hypothetical protein TRFO_06794 [Tritrichomonas foetus]|uniref:Protein kinase domain-containing protein n=1 Tax=Tritrichomonas foetus TaxID=1144522 RepID=A0A1J4JVF0_9EUKA|nr:hypothetical protein TRFO_06794 [Tritrichomonas foetus]|eukprot:OHT03135.1 hypothetical protein TRFO_06794 [Tritrichomonas foetus]